MPQLLSARPHHGCLNAPYLPAGEARTDAFVQANGGEEAAFDHLVEPASLILVTLLRVCVWGGGGGGTTLVQAWGL